jgi:hypothetical protein
MTYTDSSRYHCNVCDGFKTLIAEAYLPGHEPVCTCGAGPLDKVTLHDVNCDTVPCPFCQLLDEPVHQEV